MLLLPREGRGRASDLLGVNVLDDIEHSRANNTLAWGSRLLCLFLSVRARGGLELPISSIRL